jgi:SAM-dependent methyltransferase
MNERSTYGSASLFRDTTKLTLDEARELVARLELRAKTDDEATTRAEYLSLLDVGPGQHVLDVGCGSGVVARDIARRVQPNGRVVGVDPSPALLAAAQELMQSAGLASLVDLKDGDCRALPFAAESFDAVIAATVLSHVPDGERAISEMVRVVRRGGRIGVFDFDGDGLLIAHPDRETTRRIVAGLSDHGAVNSWLVRDLPGLFAGAGLEDIRVRAFMPLERRGDGFYAGMAERAAAVARDAGVITDAQSVEWIKILRQQIDAGRFLCGRLHLFCWGRKPQPPTSHRS